MPPPEPPIVNDGRRIAGKPISSMHRARLLDAVTSRDLRAREADPRHRLLEQLAILGHLDRLDGRAEQLDAVLLEQARLAARPSRG